MVTIHTIYLYQTWNQESKVTCQVLVRFEANVRVPANRLSSWLNEWLAINLIDRVTQIGDGT